MSKKIKLAFDIGESYIKIAKKEGSKINVYMKQTPENLVKEGILNAPLVVADLLSDLRKELKLPKCECGLVVSDEFTVCRTLTLPAMTEKQLEVNLPFEFSDYISGKPQRYVYDYAIREMIHDEEGNPKEMVLTGAVMSKEAVYKYVDIFKDAGFKLRTIIPQEIALTNVMKQAVSLGRAEEGKEYCIVNLGHRSTQVYIFKGSNLEVVRNLYVGGATIDAAISETEMVDEFVARTYKNKNYNNVLETEHCKEAFGRIAVEVMKVINFYRFSNRESSLEDVYFFGGCSNISELCGSIADATNLTIKPMYYLLPMDVHKSEDMIGLYGIGVLMQ